MTFRSASPLLSQSSVAMLNSTEVFLNSVQITSPEVSLALYRPPQVWNGDAGLKAILSPTFVAVAAVIWAGLWNLFERFLRRRINKDGNSIPRGPVGLPIIGSFPFLTSYPELTLDYWAKKFGPLYSIYLGNQLFVIISDTQIAKDLMVTNGAIFSSRKQMFIKSQTILKGRGITVTPYGDKWKRHRRLAKTYLTPRTVERHSDLFEIEALTLVRELYIRGKAGTSPINPSPHVGRASLNIVLTIIFGTRTDSIDHPLVARALYISREFMNCTGPVANLVDFVPLLQKIGTPMTARAKRLHEALLETYGGMVDEVDARLQQGEDVPDCLAKNLLLCREEEKLDRLDIIMLCTAFMIGGVETTAAIIQWFAALIPAYPEIQARAHAELDRVVGRDRLPTVEDEKDLPYVHAVIKEIERFRNPFWLGTPHTSSADFTYQGQFIPKGTVCILNTYTMHHDEQRYPDAKTFNPDRYLNDSLTCAESANLSNPAERDHWMFGAGRRICPGMWYAERGIWLGISRMLWAFKMEEIPDEKIDLNEYDGKSGRSPVPFRIKMVPRDEQVALIHELVPGSP